MKSYVYGILAGTAIGLLAGIVFLLLVVGS